MQVKISSLYTKIEVRHVRQVLEVPMAFSWHGDEINLVGCSIALQFNYANYYGTCISISTFQRIISFSILINPATLK